MLRSLVQYSYVNSQYADLTSLCDYFTFQYIRHVKTKIVIHMVEKAEDSHKLPTKTETDPMLSGLNSIEVGLLGQSRRVLVGSLEPPTPGPRLAGLRDLNCGALG